MNVDFIDLFGIIGVPSELLYSLLDRGESTHLRKTCKALYATGNQYLLEDRVASLFARIYDLESFPYFSLAFQPRCCRSSHFVGVYSVRRDWKNFFYLEESLQHDAIVLKTTLISLKRLGIDISAVDFFKSLHLSPSADISYETLLHTSLPSIKDTDWVAYGLSLLFPYGEPYVQDQEIVALTVQKAAQAVSLMNVELRTNKTFIRRLALLNGEILQYLPEYKGDFEVALQCVQQYPLALKDVAEEFLRNETIVFEAGSRSHIAFQFADPSLKDNDAFMARLVRVNGLTLKEGSLRIRANEEIAHDAVTQNGTALQYVEESLKENPKIFNAALENNLLSIRFVPHMVRETEKIKRRASFSHRIRKPQQDGLLFH
jgi:hypothetical protein